MGLLPLALVVEQTGVEVCYAAALHPAPLCRQYSRFATVSLHLERKKACHGIFLTTILIGREATVFIIIVFFFFFYYYSFFYFIKVYFLFFC